jgi:predicted dehydrogenase
LKPIRVAVVGAGHLGRIHTRILSTLPQFSLVGVVDTIESSRDALAREHSTEAIASHEQLFGRIDAAVIAAPTQFHHRIALDMLDRGVHLLVEKPLASRHADAADLVDAARARRLILQVGHVERFNPAWAAMLPHVREPRYIEAVRRGGYSFRSTDIGVVLDLMIHDIDLTLSIVGSPIRSVDALGAAVFGPHEDIAQARLVFENGCVANLSASRTSHTAARTMQLWSQRAMASLDFTARTANIVKPSDALLRRELQLETIPAEERAQLKDRLLAEHLPVEQISCDPVDAITAELVDFAESIQQGRMPRVSGEAACEAVSVAERILASIASHQWDGHADGRIGPNAIPGRSVIPAPHWATRPMRSPIERREAG